MSYIDLTFQTRISKIRSFSCVEVITQLHISELKEILRSQSLQASQNIFKSVVCSGNNWKMEL